MQLFLLLDDRSSFSMLENWKRILICRVFYVETKQMAVKHEIPHKISFERIGTLKMVK
jgi:hypothetical protein